MKKISVIGISGYTGEELLRVLSNHPEVKISHLVSSSFYGKHIKEVYPNLKLNIVCEKWSIKNLSKDTDLTFLCLPHTVSQKYAEKLLSNGIKVIDLSADFRLKNAKVFNKWYKTKHKFPSLLKKAVYGLPEIHLEKIKKASLVANPGCYSTAVILGLAPAINYGIINTSSIVIDAKSGVSGAGRRLSLLYHFPECNENIVPYSVEGHRHIPEMIEQLSSLSNEKVNITFIPHLIPINRGILVSIYTEINRSTSLKRIIKLYKDFYSVSFFVEVLENQIPQIKDVIKTNYCRIGFSIQNNILIIFSTLDNLLKGASGQAIENMNILFGFSQNMGLL